MSHGLRMFRALSARFIPAALVFLALCISVLSIAAASTLHSFGASRESCLDLLNALLR